MDDRERFARNALFCRKRAAVLKDPASIRHWTRLAEEYERLALNPAAGPPLPLPRRLHDRHGRNAPTASSD
jgi:hypothetical protein